MLNKNEWDTKEGTDIFMKNEIDLKACLGLILLNQYCPLSTKKKIVTDL